MSEADSIKHDIEELFYLRDSRSICGNCVLFWKKNNRGYTCNLNDAKVLTKAEAFAQNKMRETDIPYPKSVVDSLVERHLDIQDFNRWQFENIKEIK